MTLRSRWLLPLKEGGRVGDAERSCGLEDRRQRRGCPHGRPQTAPSAHLRGRHRHARLCPRGGSVTRAPSSPVWGQKPRPPHESRGHPGKAPGRPWVRLLRVRSSSKTPGDDEVRRGTRETRRSGPGRQPPARPTLPRPKGTAQPSGAQRVAPGPPAEAHGRPRCPVLAPEASPPWQLRPAVRARPWAASPAAPPPRSVWGCRGALSEP